MPSNSRKPLLLLLLSSVVLAAPPIQVLSPEPYQVVQRVDYIPSQSFEHAIGGPTLGSAMVPVYFRAPACAGQFEHRIHLLEPSTPSQEIWTAFAPTATNDEWRSQIKMPAGGWYGLELRCKTASGTSQSGSVNPVGVGEVFLIAGQSNAGGYSDALTRIEDPRQRVSAYNVKTGHWAVANDPQPNVGDGGTIWPSMCNALLANVNVPIGLVNVAVDATASSQWLPGGKIFPALAEAARTIHRFRAVLWQQGESDVIAKTPTQDYVDHLVAIRKTFEKESGSDAPWLLAKSTFHPTVYNDPVHEAQIRDGIAALWKMPGFLPGPDTDMLGGENRGGAHSHRHFSALGQKNAGLMWFAAILAGLFGEGRCAQ